MRLRWKLTLVLISMVLAACDPLMSVAQVQFAGPPVVRMVGVVQSFDEQKSHDLNMLTLTFNATKRLFQVNRVDIVSGMDPGTSLLDTIFPPELRLMGASKILAPLEQPTIVGKTITVEGSLYIAAHNYEVTSVNVAEGTSQ
jgi:hypothetical protein